MRRSRNDDKVDDIIIKNCHKERSHEKRSHENKCKEENCKIDKTKHRGVIINNIDCCGCNGATTQIRGMQVQLKNPDIVSIDPGAPIIFDTTISPLSSFISYNNITGEIIIIQNGVFYINWWVAIDGFGGGADVVITMAIITSAGDNIQASNSFLSGQISGNALISVTASPVCPVILKLVNVTDGTIGYGSTPNKADLTIVNVTL